MHLVDTFPQVGGAVRYVCSSPRGDIFVHVAAGQIEAWHRSSGTTRRDLREAVRLVQQLEDEHEEESRATCWDYDDF